MTMKYGNPAVSVLVMNAIYFHLPIIYIHLTFINTAPVSLASSTFSMHYASTNVPL